MISASSFPDDAARNKFMHDNGLGDLQKINKDNFDNKVPKHNTNCGHCTLNVARWFKTGQAHPAAPSDPMSLQQPTANARQHGLEGKFERVADYDEINRKMAAQPPGHVASVAAKWPDQVDGHFFNVAKGNDGSVVYLDGQSGLPADISKKPSELYATDFKDAPSAGNGSSSAPSPGQGPQWEYRDPKPQVDLDSPPPSPAASSPPPSPISPGNGDVQTPDSPSPSASSGSGDVEMTDAAPSPPSPPPTDRDGDVEMG